jgi:hypothetical protein
MSNKSQHLCKNMDSRTSVFANPSSSSSTSYSARMDGAWGGSRRRQGRMASP